MAVAASLALVISSCEPHRSVDDVVRPEVVGNPLAFVGELHDEALGHLLIRLEGASRTAPLTRARAVSIAETGLDEFFTSVFDRRVCTGGEIAVWRRRLARDPGANAIEPGARVRSATPSDEAIELSARADEYIERILRLTEEVRAVDSLKAELGALEEEATDELSGDDLDAVYATSAVAGSSAECWDLHYDDWAALCAASPDYCQNPGAASEASVPGRS